MKKGISFYFGFDQPPENRIKVISKAGFDCIMTTADPRRDKSNGTIDSQMKLFKKYGLEVSSLHMRYISTELPDFWKDTELGGRLEKDLIEDIEIANKYGFLCVVVHLCGKSSKVGFERLDRVLEVCKKLGMPIAIENIDFQELFVEVMDHYKNNPYVQFCYDVGHNNCFDPEFNYIKKYGDRLTCLHLHDNMGEEDEHTLNKYGNIDWNEVAKKLATVSNELSLDYELLLYKKCPETMEEVAEIAYSQACELEKMILKYKK